MQRRRAEGACLFFFTTSSVVVPCFALPAEHAGRHAGTGGLGPPPCRCAWRCSPLCLVLPQLPGPAQLPGKPAARASSSCGVLGDSWGWGALPLGTGTQALSRQGSSRPSDPGLLFPATAIRVRLGGQPRTPMTVRGAVGWWQVGGTPSALGPATCPACSSFVSRSSGFSPGPGMLRSLCLCLPCAWLGPLPQVRAAAFLPMDRTLPFSLRP